MPHAEDAARFKRWKASADAMCTKREEPFCAETRLVALHDCVGNLLDCASIHSSSVQAISYFQQWHAPLVLSSLLTDNIVEQRKRRAITRWEQEIGRAHV